MIGAKETECLQLGQDPALLELTAARPGEMVHIEINSTYQTLIVQEGASVYMDCLPWLNKFGSDGVAVWYIQEINIVGYPGIVAHL